MNKKLLIIIALILIVAVAIVFGNRNASTLSGNQAQPSSGEVSIEEGFLEAEKVINSQAPIKIDDQTRLNKAVAGPGDKMTYFYSLTTVAIAELKPEMILKGIKPKLLQSLCSNKDMQPVMQAGAQLIYVYADKNGDEVGRINVVNADCS